MTEIDWHISCEENKKKCVLYEDKDEKYPAVKFNVEDGYVEIERIDGIMEISAKGLHPIHGQNLKVELTI